MLVFVLKLAVSSVFDFGLVLLICDQLFVQIYTEILLDYF